MLSGIRGLDRTSPSNGPCPKPLARISRGIIEFSADFTHLHRRSDSLHADSRDSHSTFDGCAESYLTRALFRVQKTTSK